MKTKIVYISGNEIFDIREIHAAFEEVRNALNLTADTVLFGVPVDNEDAGIMPTANETVTQDAQNTCIPVDMPQLANSDIEIESKVEIAQKKPNRSQKKSKNDDVIEPIVEIVSETTEITEISTDITNAENTNEEDKIVPISSVLDSKDTEDIDNGDIEIISEDSGNFVEPNIEKQQEHTSGITEDEDAAGLEKLLSEMTPLQEDILEEQTQLDPIPILENDTDDDVSVDATLEKLANDFIENQDKIGSGTKSSSRSKIGKFRNIISFKPKEPKDTDSCNLFSWGGVAANDEEFSVPGFFTSSASKK